MRESDIPVARVGHPGPGPGHGGALVRAWLERLPAGLVARRAWPAGDGLAVEAVGAGGIVGVELTADRVRVLAGTDPRLPALAAELARPGAELLGHRPGRRAVLRRHGRDGVEYVKVLRPGRAGRVADALRTGARLAAGSALAVPAVRAVDDAAGLVRLAALPGPTLHELLACGAAGAVDTVARTAAALAALAAAPAAALPHHDPDAEAAVLAGWADAAARWGGPDLSATAAEVAAALRALPARPPVVAHRDLHDKQVVATPVGVGVLDLDTLCRADPALDRGNLLAHLRLRVLQGRCPPALAARCGCPLGPTDPAVAVATAAALLRLAAVYTFRPGPPGLPGLLHDAARAALDPTRRIP